MGRARVHRGTRARRGRVRCGGPTGAPLSPQVLAIAREVLADARARDSAALDQLLYPGGSDTPAALNKLLAQPGVYAQIITLLTETHGVPQDGFTAWPGFLLAGTQIPLGAADAKVLGVASSQAYKGLVINIGAPYDVKPYVPKLYSILELGLSVLRAPADHDA